MTSKVINTTLATEFATTFHELAQQKRSRLRSVLTDSIVFKGDDYALDRSGQIDAREVVGRYEKVTFDSPVYSRRQLARKRFVVALPVDASDVRGSFQDYMGRNAQDCVAAMNREFDRVITKAAFADVLTASSGKSFDTLVDFASDGGATVDATGGLTKAKLLEVKQNFLDLEVGIDEDEPLWLQISGDENTSLMGEATLTSTDFTSLNRDANDRGIIRSGEGINFVHFGDSVPNPVIQRNAGGTERELVAASAKGIMLGISQDVKITMDERTDLLETKQVLAVIDIGAVRTEGARVQKVRVTV